MKIKKNVYEKLIEKNIKVSNNRSSKDAEILKIINVKK